MRTLIFSSLYPLPENIGTRMRTMNFVRFFRKRGEVDMAFLRAGHEDRTGDGLFRKEYWIRNAVSPSGSGNSLISRDVRDRLRRLAERRPWIVTEWSPDAVKALASIVTGGDYDLVLCRYMHDSYPFLRLPKSLRRRVVIDFDDIYSQSLFDVYVPRAPGFYQGLKRHVQKVFLLSYQKKFLTFGAALFCSASDREAMTGGVRTRNCFVVPNTYPPNKVLRAEEESGHRNRETLLFIGALDYGPNVAGLVWFLETVFPLARERSGEVRLLVAGRRPTNEVVRLCAEKPGVELHADVSDVGPLYARCGAVVVPLLSGGGTRIKILEAAVAGRPVLATPAGAYGIDCADGRDIVLFSDGRSFIEGLDRLAERAVYETCVVNLRALVEEKYSPAAFERAMEGVIAGVS
jgi:polysaccharide biosynthesis protein PslH